MQKDLSEPPPRSKPGFPTEMLAAGNRCGSLLAREAKPSCKVSPSTALTSPCAEDV